MPVHKQNWGHCLIMHDSVEIPSLTSTTGHCDLEKATFTSPFLRLFTWWHETCRFREHVESKMSLKPKCCCCYHLQWVMRQGKPCTSQTNACLLNQDHSPRLRCLVRTGSLRGFNWEFTARVGFTARGRSGMGVQCAPFANLNTIFSCWVLVIKWSLVNYSTCVIHPCYHENY